MRLPSPPRHTTVHLVLARLPQLLLAVKRPADTQAAEVSRHRFHEEHSQWPSVFQRAQLACLKRAVTRRVHAQVHTHTHTHKHTRKNKNTREAQRGTFPRLAGGHCFLLPAAMSTPVSSTRKKTSLTTADRMYTMGVTRGVTQAGEGSPLLLRSLGGDGAGGGAAGHATGCATGRATCRTVPKPTAGSAARGPPWTDPGISCGPSSAAPLSCGTACAPFRWVTWRSGHQPAVPCCCPLM